VIEADQFDWPSAQAATELSAGGLSWDDWISQHRWCRTHGAAVRSRARQRSSRQIWVNRGDEGM